VLDQKQRGFVSKARERRERLGTPAIGGNPTAGATSSTFSGLQVFGFVVEWYLT